MLEEGKYLSLSPDENGHLASRLFPGLVLDVEALHEEDFSTVLSLVQERVGTDAHQAFVGRLRMRPD